MLITVQQSCKVQCTVACFIVCNVLFLEIFLLSKYIVYNVCYLQIVIQFVINIHLSHIRYQILQIVKAIYFFFNFESMTVLLLTESCPLSSISFVYCADIFKPYSTGKSYKKKPNQLLYFVCLINERNMKHMNSVMPNTQNLHMFIKIQNLHIPTRTQMYTCQQEHKSAHAYKNTNSTRAYKKTKSTHIYKNTKSTYV